MGPVSAVPLITLWEEYIQKNKNADVHLFARWILKEKSDKPLAALPDRQQRKKAAININTELKEEWKAMMLISRLNRFMQISAKPVLKKLGLAKDHEYGMLLQVCLLKNPNKKEVAKKLLLENSTAVEITKRLAQRGLLKELDDPNDKRATRLSVTEKGMQKLFESHELTENLHASFLDCLSDVQKKELVKLLEEVEQYQSVKLEV